MTNQQAGYCILAIGMAMFIAALITMFWDKQRKKKYSEVVTGKIVDHQWRRMNSMLYPCAVVEYTVGYETCQCVQSYAMVHMNASKHAKYDWELDDAYCLHSYISSKCEIHVDPIEEWYPLGREMDVHYVAGKPHKAYCGALASMRLAWRILGIVGLEIAVFGLLLSYIMA